MTNTNYPRGSEWCKWDLHIHSIASDGEGTPMEIVAKAKEKELSAIALTDHHTAKNIDEIKAVAKSQGIAVISGIEFRTEYGNKSVHMIGLFPDKHKNTELNSKALHELILSPLGLSETKIIAKGKEKKPSLTDDEKAFKEGMFLVQVSFKNAADKIHEYGGLVVVHAGSKENSIENEMKHQGTSIKNVTTLYDSLGTVKEELFKENFIDICEIRKEDDNEEFYLKTFNKPSITASDAHKLSDIGIKSVWIKANPTFEGLKQVAKESSRIFIGDIPPLLKRVIENPQRYIKKITFSKLDTPPLNETWFEELELELNPGLVAIIGNKGMGKSALADTLGLLGDTPNYEDFSFLNEKKFRKIKPNRSASFRATLNWESGLLPETKLLSNNPHEQAIEKVKYLPQGYLETLCNDNHTNFLIELRNVIFNYIPENKRFGKTNLEELEKFTADSIKKEIQQIASEIENSNQRIAYLEKKGSDSYKAQIESHLSQKKTDLEAHKQTEPPVVTPPTDTENLEKTKQVTEAIDGIKKQVEELEKAFSESKQNQNETSLSKVNLEKVLTSLTLLQNEFNKTKNEIRPTLAANGIDVDDVIKLTVERKSVKLKLTDKATQLDELNKLLNTELQMSIPFQIAELKRQLSELQNNLDETSRAYQRYLAAKEEWHKAEKLIIGDATQLGTIEYFENELNYISTKLVEDLIAEINKRNESLKKLFSKKLEILTSFKTFYQPITDFFSKGGDILKEYEIKLDVENKLTGFEDKFLTQISSAAKGSFYGSEDARRKLLEIVQQSKWETEEDILSFTETLVDHLKFDKRPNNNNEKREVDKQLKSDYTVEGLYNFLFTLDYLEPTYKLKLNEKNIEALSPGERGALLLIFYLALDRNDIPLVIDQPEENLDNQSVFTLLAQFIKSAKQKRQVMIVTHNPNLAVVCDADQIVHVRIEKHNKNKVIFNSGALENPEINNAVVDILEGTYKAFDTRDMKYKAIPRV
jgi:ABC-type lipoprotein export system ATPase subunit